MSEGPITEPTDAGVPLDALTAYLRATGWTLVDQDGRTALWTRPDHDDIRVVTPVRVTLDYADRVSDAAAALSQVEQRGVLDVLADIASGAGADTLLIRLTPRAPTGEAPLPFAHEALGALRQFVVGSASGVESSALVLPPRPATRAIAYADKVTMSTSPGSFVVRLVMPLVDAFDGPSAEAPDVLIDLPSIPFGRRVTMRMRKATERALQLADAVNAGDEHLEAFGRQVRGAPNATELAALAALGVEGDERDRVRLHFGLSPLARPAKNEPPRAFTITPAQQRALADAADHLRVKQPRPDVTFVGKVIRLAREEHQGPGFVWVGAVLDDTGKERHIQLELTNEDYMEAIRAHWEGLFVRARGDINRRGNWSVLTPVRTFEILGSLLDE